MMDRTMSMGRIPQLSEIQYGDQISLSPVLTEGHLSAGFVNGRCYPTVAIHPLLKVEGIQVSLPTEFERCVFTILRPTEEALDGGVPNVMYGASIRLGVHLTGHLLKVNIPDEDDEDNYQQASFYFAPKVDGGIPTLEETFRILPRGRVREEGEVVRVGEQILIESAAKDTPGYLSVGPLFSKACFSTLPESACSPQGRSVELSETPSLDAVWSVDAYDLQCNEPDLPAPGTVLRVGEAVVLFHKEKEAFLEGIADPDIENNVVFSRVKPPKATYSVRDLEHPSGAVWMIESNSIVTGGAVTTSGFQSAYRLRHVATGKYLCCHSPKEGGNSPQSARGRFGTASQRHKLSLVSSLVKNETEDYIDDTLATFHPLDALDETVKAGGYARIELASGGTWLHCTSDVITDSHGNTTNRLVAGAAPRLIYEDLFSIHTADFHIAPALARVMSIIPLLRSAAQIFAKPETYVTWDEMNFDNEQHLAVEDDPNEISYPDGAEKNELLAAMQVLITPTREDLEVSPSFPSARPKLLPISIDNGGSGDKIIDSPDSSALSQHFDSSDDDLDDCDAGDAAAAACVVVSIVAVFGSSSSPSPTSSNPLDDMTAPQITVVAPEYTVEFNNSMANMNSTNDVTSIPVPSFDIRQTAGRLGGLGSASAPATRRNSSIRMPPRSGQAPLWYVAGKYLKRSGLSGDNVFNKQGMAVPCVSAGAEIKEKVDQLTRASWKASLNRLIASTTTALSDLIAFLAQVPITETYKRPNLPISLSRAVSSAKVVFACRLTPVKRRQILLYEQGIHNLVYNLLSAPFKEGGLSLSSPRKYEALNVILRLGHRLIMHMVAGCDKVSEDVSQYIPFFERQSGFRLNASDTIHAIVHNHPNVLASLKDETIEKFVRFVPNYGRSPSYLNLLSALCVCCGKGITRTQNLVCNEVLLLQDTERSLLHRTRINKKTGQLEIELLRIESESLADHGDSSMILAHGLVTPTTGDLDKTEPMFFEGRQWVPLQEFVSSGTYNAVKYFERQLNLLAALCAENTVCSKRVAQLIPRDHILTALEKGTGSDAVLGDAVRTCFLALARVLYLQPSKISDVRLMQRWKRLLCEDAARNMTLCIERTSRNEQVCETLKCLLLLVESGRFSKDELKNLAPILCQLLDASTDAMSEALFDALTSGAASLMGHFLHIDASSVMWQQAIVDGLPRKGSDDAKFQSTDQNKKVMDVKLVACQLLKATQTYGIAISDWVHNLKVNIQGKGCLKGKHGLAKVLLEVTMYRGNDELFETAFLLLCNCLADDGDDVLANKYTGPDKTECSAVISLAAIIKQDVTNTPTHRPTPGQPPKDGVLVTHFVSHFANNFDDTFSVCFMLRVFTYLINSEKESGGEAAMRTMQCHLDRLGCTLLMTSLIEAPKEDVVEHALIFGIALLEEGNLQVQTQLMSYFDSLSDEAFFQCIRNRLHKAIAELKELEVKEKRRGLADLGGNSLKFQISPERVHQESKLSNVTKTLRLLQLFCEGHNLELQCYIHSQPDNLHSVDLVKESLMVLKATISVPPACYGSVLFELLLQCFNSLTEYCQGPCQENQESLVNAHLAREVSNILNLEYERATEGRINREQTDEVQNAATITLLSLLEGCEDAKVPNVLLQTVDLEQIGTALDMCWRNRKRGSAGDDGTDTALELGFNLFIFMETLASFDSQNFLLENKHFMRNENGYTYFHAMTGRIEIAAREGRLQRVYFRIPELCLNLSKSSRDSILWNVDRETSGSRISSFFSKADDALYEMWFNDKYFSSKTLHQGKQDLAEGSYSGILKIAAVWVQRRSAEIHNTTVWLSVLIAFLNGLEIGALVTIPVVGFLQLILTVVSLLHRAASQGPILAHTQQKDDQKGTWNRLHSEISPEGLLALRRAQDVQADIDLISNNVYTTTCYSPRPKRSPRKKSVFAETPSPSLSGVHQRTRHRSSPSLGMGSDSGILAGLQPSDSDTPIHVPPKTRHSISSASGGASLGVNESKLGASISGLRRTSLQLNSASQSTVGGGESHTAGQFFLSAKPRKARTWSDDDDDDEVTESNGSTGHKGSPGVTPNQWRRRSGELRPAPISATPLSATSSPDITTSTGNNSRSVSVKVPSLKFENLNTSSEPEPPTSPHVVSPLFADVTHSRNFKFSPGLKPYKGGFGNPNSSPLKKPSPTLSPTVRKGVKNCFAAQTTTEAAEDLNAVAGRDTELISVLQCLIRDSHFNGHCFMVLCSLLGLGVSPLFFTGQLFSIVANSPILQSVIRSITKNGRSLLLTGLLAVIIVFHFAVAGHAFFKESYQNHEEAASSLSRTFVHTFFNGIALGGISDLMHPPSFDADEDGRIDTMYGLRMAFDFSFFVIVVVILLNIIFGIIIDTFAELRAEKQKVEEEIRTRCFICGIEATEFDRHASGFDCHIKQDHNMWCYIYFIHHLRTKEESEFTGQESYVWNLMKALDLSFFPANRAICLQNKSVAGSEDADIKKIGRQQASRHEMALEKKLNELWVEQKAQNRKMDTRLRDVIGAVSSLQRQLPQIDDSPHARRTRSSSFRDLNTSSVRGCFQRNLSGV